MIRQVKAVMLPGREAGDDADKPEDEQEKEK